jgi:type II protein arginine methyltransferase
MPSEDEILPTYHFIMLNDVDRNLAFYSALEKVITNESLVIDLGAGVMLLTMMSKTLGAKMVVSIERNDHLVSIGREILSVNGLDVDDGGIRIINDESFNVNLDDIGRQPDILVSETLDGWIIGEGFLSSLSDLRSRNILGEDTIIIPSFGELFIQLVETAYSFPDNGQISGFSFEPMRKFKPFTTMSLQHGYAIQNLSVPIKLFDFDFQGFRPIDARDFHYPYTDGAFDFQILNIDIIEDGSLHGAVFWFNVYTDQDKEFLLSNSPSSRTHWKPMLCLFGKDFSVRKDHQLRIEIVRISERYHFALEQMPLVRERLVMVLNECDTTYKVFVSESSDDVADRVFAFKLSRSSEWNVLTASIGGVITAEARQGMNVYFQVNYAILETDDSSSTEREIRKFFLPCVEAPQGKLYHGNERKKGFMSSNFEL